MLLILIIKDSKEEGKKLSYHKIKYSPKDDLMTQPHTLEIMYKIQFKENNYINHKDSSRSMEEPLMEAQAMVMII